MQDDILVLAPTGRDAAMTCDALTSAGLRTRPFAAMDDVCAAIREGAGALLIAEEAFDAQSFEQLARTLDGQEPWSDLPIVLLAGTAFTDSVDRAARVLSPLRNVMVLERPVRVSVLVTAIQVALRARHRQYELRGHLERREQDARERAAVLDLEQKARREAEAANRLKDEFLATVSHELRTPVNVILGWSGMLRRDSDNPDRRDRAIEVIHRNAETQAKVIDELLDISRIITGKLRMEIVAVDLKPLIEGAIEAVRPALDAKRLRIDTTWSPEAPRLFGDPDRLRQVFFNLLTNAVKFTPADGRITLSVSRDGGFAKIRVADTGIGIPLEAIPFIFDRFRQVDSTTTREHGGLGLGLAIVRQLVELHGGTVQAFSGGPGRGSEFVVTLPTRKQKDGIGPHQPAAMLGLRAAALPRLDDVRLLVVDDDRDGREMVTELLQGLGAVVAASASGSDALIVVRDWTPDIVIADIAMPEMDGFELIDRLRDTLGRDTVPPAIALTAYARVEDKARALKAGYTAHVAKPVDALILVRTIRGLLPTAA